MIFIINNIILDMDDIEHFSFSKSLSAKVVYFSPIMPKLFHRLGLTTFLAHFYKILHYWTHQLYFMFVFLTHSSRIINIPHTTSKNEKPIWNPLFGKTKKNEKNPYETHYWEKLKLNKIKHSTKQFIVLIIKIIPLRDWNTKIGSE